MKRNLIAILAITSMSLVGCADDDSYVLIEGSMSLELGYAQAGFEFAPATQLAATAEQANPGCAAGGCLITLDEAGAPTSLEVWLHRGNSEDQGLGFRTFDVTIDEQSASVNAVVAATDGDVTYLSEGSAACTISDLSDVTANGDAALQVDCDMQADGDLTAHASADLVLYGCFVQ